MTARADDTAKGHGIREVLAAGWRMFRDGFGRVFPWVLAAELLQLLSSVSTDQGSLDLQADISTYLQADDLGRGLFIGFGQAVLYAIAVLQLAALAGEKPQGSMAWNALRTAPALFIGYLIYSLLMLLGLGVSLLLFMNMLALGVGPAVAITLIPLVPTTIASTALALFAYPAVLERRGPFASLSESARLAKSSWARVTAVISVPALFMLCEWMISNGVDLWKILSGAYAALTQVDVSGDAGADLQGLAESAMRSAGTGHGLLLQLVGVLLTALVWWYALAVCYAQYRDLKQSKD